MRHLLSTAILATSLMAGPNARASDTAVLPAVHTDLKRDNNVLPYGQINRVLILLRQHGEGLFRLDFKVDTQRSKVALADLKLAVRSDDADYPIKLSDTGAFDLPVLPEAEGKTADLATNAGKGQLSIAGTLELTVAPEDLTMAKVRQIMRVARTLREELLPWYLRWLFPRIDAVRVCSATPTWELEWRENGQLLGLPLPLAAGERDPEARKGAQGRPCTLLNGQEQWPDAARLLPPANSKVSVKL
ncbi:hypothetical protein [Roseateles sp. BYS87W]|uniref:DUF2987 domain-containing protein n=1 Tax=Pelomonas baiyunensis TaxID=3299026 RepID=A0ABW7GVL9_9BURK